MNAQLGVDSHRDDHAVRRTRRRSICAKRSGSRAGWSTAGTTASSSRARPASRRRSMRASAPRSWRRSKKRSATRDRRRQRRHEHHARLGAADAEAEAAGADAILAVVPYYNKPTQSGMLAHFGAIAEATRCRSIVYNIPRRTGATCCRRRCSSSRAGTRTSRRQRVERRSRADRHAPARRRAGFIVWAGDDYLFLPSLGARRRRRRRRRVASLLAGVPRMVDAYRAGASTKRRRSIASLLPLIDALFATTSPIPVKWAMNELGFAGASAACRSTRCPPPSPIDCGPLIAPYASPPSTGSGQAVQVR